MRRGRPIRQIHAGTLTNRRARVESPYQFNELVRLHPTVGLDDTERGHSQFASLSWVESPLGLAQAQAQRGEILFLG